MNVDEKCEDYVFWSIEEEGQTDYIFYSIAEEKVQADYDCWSNKDEQG